MKYFNNFISFFVYSNLFITGCALLMLYQTDLLFNGGHTNTNLAGFVLFSTLCSYSFHWYLTGPCRVITPRINWLGKYRLVHTIFFFVGLAGAVIFLSYLLPYWPWLIGSAVVTFLYSAPKIPHPLFRALRKVALGKTIFLAFVWMYVTTVLPITIGNHEWTTHVYLFILHRFFLVYAICILFDYRDREDDRAAGIRSLITFMTERNILLLFAGSLLVAVAAAVGLIFFEFSVMAAVFLVIPCIITGLLYKRAKRDFADMFFYFILDGLMALSALLMLVAGI